MSSQGILWCSVLNSTKWQKRVDRQALSELFRMYRVWEYIYTCYEALHDRHELYYQ